MEAARFETNIDRVIEDLCVPGTKWNYKQVTNQPTNFPSAALNRYVKAWNLFICAKLMPSTHQHDIPADRAIILWGVLSQEST